MDGASKPSFSAPSATVDSDLARAATGLPRVLQAAGGYLDLAVGPPARLGIEARLRRRLLRKSLRLASRSQVGPTHQGSRWLLIGQALRMLGRHRTAVVVLRAALADPSTYRDAMLGIAWCCKRLGRLDDAVATLLRAIAGTPRDASLHYNLACYLALSRRPREALRELAWSLQLNPRLCSAARNEPDFVPLHALTMFHLLTDHRPRLAAGETGPA